jgi:hypothetical protein
VSFLRHIRTKSTSQAIARLTAGMITVALDKTELAPRVCGHCRGIGRAGISGICTRCGGAGTTRSFAPEDPTNVIVAQGPYGLGYQRLIAVALADGRAGFVHLRWEGGLHVALFVWV